MDMKRASLREPKCKRNAPFEHRLVVSDKSGQIQALQLKRRVVETRRRLHEPAPELTHDDSALLQNFAKSKQLLLLKRRTLVRTELGLGALFRVRRRRHRLPIRSGAVVSLDLHRNKSTRASFRPRLYCLDALLGICSCLIVEDRFGRGDVTFNGGMIGVVVIG